jgi:hypothetical protein
MVFVCNIIVFIPRREQLRKAVETWPLPNEFPRAGSDDKSSPNNVELDALNEKLNWILVTIDAADNLKEEKDVQGAFDEAITRGIIDGAFVVPQEMLKKDCLKFILKMKQKSLQMQQEYQWGDNI